MTAATQHLLIWLIWAFVAVLAVAGGWLGWLLGTRLLYVRSIGADPSNESMSRGRLLRRQIQRVVLTLLGAAAGVVAGMIFLIIVPRG